MKTNYSASAGIKPKQLTIRNMQNNLTHKIDKKSRSLIMFKKKLPYYIKTAAVALPMFFMTKLGTSCKGNEPELPKTTTTYTFNLSTLVSDSLAYKFIADVGASADSASVGGIYIKVIPTPWVPSEWQGVNMANILNNFIVPCFAAGKGKCESAGTFKNISPTENNKAAAKRLQDEFGYAVIFKETVLAQNAIK